MGTTPHGHFVRLNVAAGVMEDLGSPSSTESIIWQVAVGSDNLIYGGTYPNCKLVRLDPSTGAMADLGRLDPTQSYARYITASSDGFIYGGIGSSVMNVAAYQISSGQIQEILPANAQTVGFAQTFEGADGSFYAKAGVLEFQLSAGAANPVASQNVPGPFPQNVLSNGQQITAAASNGQLVATILNPDGTTNASFNVAYAGEPSELFRVGIGPDGNLYGSGALPIDIVRFGLPSGGYEYIGAIGSGEAYSFLPLGSNLLIGTYAASTTLFSYDPTQPFSAPPGSPSLGNPQPLLFANRNTSWRPEAMIANGDGTVSVGVVGGYGILTGPLLLWNPSTSTVQIFPVVTDQSVVSLAVANGIVVGGTSIYGGLGTQPTQPSAVLFEWAPASQAVLSETTPIAGAKTITDLVSAPNGLVYGIADSSLFEFDPIAQAVTRTNTLPLLHPIYNAIATDASGRLWGLAQEGVFNVDVPSLSATIVASPPTPISGGFAMAQNTIYLISGPSIYSYQVPVATPVFSIAAGTYTSAQTVTITNTTPGAVIYYTTDGSVPATTSASYSGPITVSTSETVQAIAAASGYSQSAVASAAYTITPPAATPVFSIAPGTYTSNQTVTITNTTPGAVIYYTTNGSVPTTASAPYSAPITVSTTETIQAIATATGYSQSAVASAAYTITPPAATPVFSIAPGTYTSTQTVSITNTTPGAVIYYTTNGSVPTTASAPYSAPITVSTTETIQAIATATGYSQSAVASAAYTITPPAATPVFSIAPGTYTSTQTVTITDITPGAVIYYTTNGSVPTTASAPYSGSITVSTTETIKAIATATGYSQSAVASAAYTITPPAATPVFSLAPGTYTSTQTVTITDTTPGAVIYYTTNGSVPTTGSAPYSGPITVSTTETIKAIAIASGYSQSAVASAAYTITPPAATPVFSLAPGTYTSTQTVTITDTTPGAVIYYTTNGSVPTTGSASYSGPITVSTTETIKAIAIANGYSQSAVASATYIISKTAATPVFSPVAGTYSSTQSVTITDSTPGATIHYTTNGSNPTTSSTRYTGAITVSATETIKAIATASGYSQSSVATAAYTIPKTASPVFSPAGGTYSSTQSVTITDSTPGATFYYTTNGSTPTSSSTRYTGAITVSSTETIKAIATANGYSQSSVATAAYTITKTAATPVISPAGGTYSSTQSVTITDATTGATIYYTTNGRTPTTSSTKYTGAISVSSTETIKALATATGYKQSAVATAAYTIP